MRATAPGWQHRSPSLTRAGSSPLLAALARNTIGALVIWRLWQWTKCVRVLYRLDGLGASEARGWLSAPLRPLPSPLPLSARRAPAELKNSLGGLAFRWMRVLPSVSRQLADEKAKLERELNHSLKGQLTERRILRLPEEGMPDEELEALMTTMARREEPKWRDGKVSGGVYHGEDGHLRMLNRAAELYAVSNPLHPDVWPSVMKFEAEVVAMTSGMLNGGDERVCGLLTSGGTESIFLSCKAHRQRARDERGITQPEVRAGRTQSPRLDPNRPCTAPPPSLLPSQIIVPRTAHAAFDKACDVLSIRLIKVDVDSRTFQVDPAAVRRRITKDTIMIVGSAPQFPHGVIDPIRELSDVARSHGGPRAVTTAAAASTHPSPRPDSTRTPPRLHPQSACTWTAAWVGSCSRSRESWATTSPSSTSGSRA